MQNKTLYFHKNNHSKPVNGSKMSIKSLKQSRQPSFTVAGVVDGNELRIGLAKCSTKDQFSKKMGRRIAEGRARSESSYSQIIEIQPEADVAKLFVSNALKIVNY